MANNISDGMILVSDYSKINVVDAKKVIEMIEDGTYVGKKNRK